MTSESVVIVGSGLAGYGVARELRRLDGAVPITMFSTDHGGFYSKPMLSNALATGKTPDSILNSDADKMANQLDITIRPNTCVVAINPTEKTITLDDDEILPYSQLVMAMGANQIRLPLQGDGVSKILTVNDLDDYRHFREELAGKKSVVVIGAGLIGCEFANDLASADYEVHVIDISDQPLGRLLPSVGGEFIKTKLEDVGVVFHLNATTQRVDLVDDRFRVMLADNEVIESDIVLSAVGLKPCISMAENAGIAVNRGIVVNQLLQSSQFKNIYALGDCAEIEGRVLPFVMPITHAARALAATLAGNLTPVRYPAMPVMVKTPACPAVVSPPAADVKGEWHVDANQDGVRALFQSESGKLLGFALLGDAVKEKNELATRLPPILA